MQIDIIVGLITVVVLFVTIGFSMLFSNFWRELGRRIRERIKSEIQVDVISAVHIQEAGLFVHCIDLELSKRSKEEMRIANMTIYDKLGREMPYVMRGHTYPATEFNIDGSETQRWRGFCHRESTGETDRVRIRLAIERIGKRTLWKSFESRTVPPREFPTGEWFFFV